MIQKWLRGSDSICQNYVRYAKKMEAEILRSALKKGVHGMISFIDNEIGGCEITNLSLISRIPVEQELLRRVGE